MAKRRGGSNRRFFLTLSGCALICFGLVWFAIRTTKLNAGQMAIWPADGLILAYMLGALRKHPFLTLFVGAFAAVCAEIVLGNPPALAIPLFCFDAIGITGVFIYMTHIVRFESIQHSKTFISLLMSCSVSALFTAFAVAVVAHLFYDIVFWPTLLTSAMGNFTGCAVLTPLVLIMTNQQTYHSATEAPLIKRIAIGGIYTSMVAAVFFQSSFPLLYLIPLGLIAVAYTTTFVTLALSVLATVAIAMSGTLMGHGPINLLHGGMEARLLSLQAFLVAITGTTLPIAALMAEHVRLKQSLIASREEADLANQAKSTFLATISHEIRTPLNGVLGMAQVIAMDDLSEIQRERISILRQSGESLLVILNDVLDFSKIEAGKIVLEEIEFDLVEMILGAAKPYEQLACEKGLSLNYDIQEVDGLFLGDPTRLRQIIYNLISNAMKFTSQGSIRLTARYQDEELTLSVSDTGIGIASEKLETLFSKFTQVDASTTRMFGGTGLGLSICRELTGLMGGALTVDSIEGEGSTFCIRLPLARVAASTPSPETSAAPVELTSELRILAAEDNPTNQLVLRTLLQFAGADVVIVENGQQAVEAWTSQAWDVILMDVHMPVMDGLTATREIRRREQSEQRQRTPIVALTANSMSHQTVEYFACGMDDHVSKPIDANVLFDVICRIVDIKGEAQLATAV